MASDVDVNAVNNDYGLSTEFQELLVATYGKKSWNVQSSQPNISRSEIFTNKMSSSWRRDVNSRPFTGDQSPQLVDPNTLKWKVWTGDQSISVSQDFDNTVIKPEMNKLTKAEFRKLTEQVREVGESMNKYRTGNGFRNLVNGVTSTPAVYRSQLAKSLKVFQPKQWKTYDTSNLDNSYVRCRPVSCIVDRSSNVDRTKLRKTRPKSSPVTFTHTVVNNGINAVYSDQYDRLTPSVVYELTNGEDPRCSFGERRVAVAGAVGTGEGQEADWTSDCESPQPVTNLEENRKSTSPTKQRESKKTARARVIPRKTSSHGSVGTDTSDIEQSLDPISDVILGGKFQIPKIEYMRPEKLDDLYIPDGKKDRKKYDFDANIVHEVEYTFKNPLPPQLRTVDFRDLAEMRIMWRDGTKKRPSSEKDAFFIDRLFDMELVQLETEDWEKARHSKLRKLQKQQQVSIFDLIKGIPPDHRPKDRKCVPDCVQRACVGDCPEKNVAPDVCIMCRQKLCEGRCSQNGYDNYARTASRAADTTSATLIKRPRSCTPCSVKHNAKLINANNIVLGRPRSGYATYETGRKSSPPKDLRPKSAASVSSSVAREFSRLDMRSYRPVSAKPKSARLRGRAASSPGKSYFSQRRYSLTDHSVPKRPQSAATTVALRKRAKSATKRIRPKTAHT